MPVFVIAPDKFKGSLSASAVAAAIARGLRRVHPDAEVRLCPMADGGDGTLDALVARGAERRSLAVTRADGIARPAPYGVLREDGTTTAIIEAACVVGITDPDGMAVPVHGRTTAGMGELIGHLLDQGVTRYMVGLGGSSTNDGGSGLLAALGLRLLDAAGAVVPATPEGLARLHRIDASQLDSRLESTSITVLSDVDNPLCGARGATAVFGPQKGVAADVVPELDAHLERFARLAEAALQRRVAHLPGAGAAGGLGFALQILGARLRPGAEVVAELVGLDAALVGADWLITGEGRSDAQTPAGKAPWLAGERARAAGVPATLLSGAIAADALPELSRLFAGCFALPDGPITLEQAIARADALLADRAEQLARLWGAARAARTP